ncbi:RDD family protein [Nonomuraea sp. NPDC049714]|uniref:RDD family protein n=1 Tax=Nonomuraea sp. NPDC049714 TaxID=3364357 RepID=UPI0037902247
MNTSSTPLPERPSEPSDQPSLASHGLRLSAFLIDCALLAVFTMTLTSLAPVIFVDMTERDARSMVVPILLLLPFLYSPIMTARWGGTLGKLVCRIRVVRVGIPDKYHGGNISYWRALTRHLSHAVMTASCIFLVLDHMWSFWDRPNCQCLHDKIVKSAVIMR